MGEAASGVREGGCRCGQVRFSISGPDLLTLACHCTGCQRMTGSAFSVTTMVADAAFQVTAGEPVIGGLHGQGGVGHFHCSYCLSWVFTRPPAAFGVVNVRSTMLDDARGFRPFVESYTSEKLPWATTPAEHSFEAFPAQEQWPELIAAFAKRAG